MEEIIVFRVLLMKRPCICLVSMMSSLM